MPEAKEGVDQLGSELASFIEQSPLVGPWKVRLTLFFSCAMAQFLLIIINLEFVGSADTSG